MWRVKYEPGTVKAVSRKEGKTVAEQEIRTAGEPAQILSLIHILHIFRARKMWKPLYVVRILFILNIWTVPHI